MSIVAPQLHVDEGGKSFHFSDTLNSCRGEWDHEAGVWKSTASGALKLAVMANTAGQWHTLIGCYGRHRRPHRQEKE